MSVKKSKKIIAILLVIILAVAGGFCGFAYKWASDDINGIRPNDTSYNLEIAKSDYQYEVAKKLMDNGIIKSDKLWLRWMDKNYPNFVYINGEYLMNSYMTYDDIAKKLQEPDVSHKGVSVCIPEGTNCMEIAAILEENGVCKADDFLQVCKSTDGFDYEFLKTVPDSDLIAYKLEGFLFPATYDLPLNADPHEVADIMLEIFDEHITGEMTDFCTNHNMTMFELINLASVVQEEAFGVESAGNIASVFMNRLESGTKLQSDVTYFYGADLRDKYGFSQEIYDAYYTYRCDGLPAGPITNPGMEIINATVNYPKTEYIYFFSDLKQEFHFAKTYDEFEKLKVKYPWE